MLTGIHFLLTYTCLYECDHCFLYCGPGTTGTFTLIQVKNVLDEAEKIGTVEWIYFEGGEPFLYYPILVEGNRVAREKGFETGVVTNAYMATCIEDAQLWLRPLAEDGVTELSVSDDAFHGEDNQGAKNAMEAARRLNVTVNSICIEKPRVLAPRCDAKDKGAPVVGGGALFKGRAAEKLTEGLPTRPWPGFSECPHEELEKPERVHVDAFGNVHVCQGVSMGNMWKTPLSQLVSRYRAEDHPICGPLVEGGPALLARTYGIEPAEEYVDECHFCFLVRRKLVERFPEYLAPRQVYGLE